MDYVEAYQNAECYDEFIKNLKDQTEDDIIDLDEASAMYDELTFKYEDR